MSAGNEISRRYKGPGDNTPYVPSWLLDDPAERDSKPALAGLPGSSGSLKADERTTTEHDGAQEHNVRMSDG